MVLRPRKNLSRTNQVLLKNSGSQLSAPFSVFATVRPLHTFSTHKESSALPQKLIPPSKLSRSEFLSPPHLDNFAYVRAQAWDNHISTQQKGNEESTVDSSTFQDSYTHMPCQQLSQVCVELARREHKVLEAKAAVRQLELEIEQLKQQVGMAHPEFKEQYQDGVLDWMMNAIHNVMGYLWISGGTKGVIGDNVRIVV